MGVRTHTRLNVLGLCSTGHGAAAALVSGQHGIRAMTLDRFTGRKHSLLFTRRELDDIRRGATPVDLSIREALVYSYRGVLPPCFVIEETLLPFLRALWRGLPLRPQDIDLVVTSNSHFGFNAGRVGTLLGTFFPNAEVVRDLEHHAVHRWQAFLPSPFSAAAVLTIDESGEPLFRLRGRKVSMSLALASHTDMQVLHEHLYPRSSPGLLYADFSRFIGHYAGEEGKTMGLAPYGHDIIYRELRPRLELFDDGSFRFMEPEELCAFLGARSSKRDNAAPVEPAHADIAYAAQRLLEDVLINAVHALGRRAPTGIENLCLAGGVALNSSANERIFRASCFKEMYICPNAGDDGHALACALYGARIVRGCSQPSEVPHDYLGPRYSDEDIRAALIRYSLAAGRGDADTVAALLAEGYIVGMFREGSEYGPRALGNRSILADPRAAETTVTVNERVKRRELYRPYAPVVLEDKAEQWFAHAGPSRFMLRVVQVRSDKQAQLAAITHIDGSARLQTITRELNPALYAIVEAFERRTGVPVLLNTSFNLAGKPIVETPDDAIDCWQSTEMDALLLGSALLLKPHVGIGSRRAPSPITNEMSSARAAYERLRAHAFDGRMRPA